jgi:hypothetical protein
MAQRNPSGKLSLLTFMVMVMIFLAVFLAGVSISVEQAGNIPVFLNLGTFALVLALGIGSYFIEILYLALLPSLPFGIIED